MRNCIVKWVIFSASFRFLWDFIPENLKSKRNSDDISNIWTNIKKSYTQNNVFIKRIPNMTFWIIYILVQISFLGTAEGVLASIFFSFSSSAIHGGWHFDSAPSP